MSSSKLDFTITPDFGGNWKVWAKYGVLNGGPTVSGTSYPHLSMKIGPQAVRIDRGDAMGDQHISTSLRMTRSLLFYPFDTYELDLPFTAYFATDLEAALTSSDVQAMPLGIVASSTISGWTLDISTADKLDGTDVVGAMVSVTARRSFAVKLFSMFIVSLMWCVW